MSGGPMGGDAGDDREDPARSATVEPPGDTSRRDFLKLAGLTLSASGLAATACEPVDEATFEALNLDPDFSTVLYRAEDMVALGFGFVNLKVDKDGRFLERKNK